MWRAANTQTNTDSAADPHATRERRRESGVARREERPGWPRLVTWWTCSITTGFSHANEIRANACHRSTRSRNEKRGVTWSLSIQADEPA